MADRRSSSRSARLEIRYWQEYAKRTRRRRERPRARREVTAYFVRRLLLIIPTFLGITLAVFVIMHFVPGGPVEREIMRLQMGAMSEGGGSGGAAAGMELPAEAIEEIRQYYGFDKPVHIRYGCGFGIVLHLDLGNSYIYQDPVWDVIKSRFPVSIFLGLTGFLLSYLVCVPLGVLKAVKHGSKFDFVSSVLVFMGYAVPGGRSERRCWSSSAAAVSGASFRSEGSAPTTGSI